MHIAYLVQQFPPEVGAGPARVSEMAARWVAAGAEVTVITGMPNRPEGRIHPEYRGKAFSEEEWEGIRVLRSWLYASPKHGFARTVANNLTFMATAAAQTLARVRTADVLIASSPPFFPHISGWLASAGRRIPLVLEIRDLWPDYLIDMGVLTSGSIGARGLFACERFLIRRAERSVVVTESFKRRIVEKGADERTVSVISNGVDTERYRSASEAPPLSGMERGDAGPVVGYLGNMGVGQDLRTVVRAAAEVSREMPEVRFVLAGDGADRSRIEELVREFGLRNVAVHGSLPKEATRAFYNACDLCLVPLANVPIFQETVPSKIFEIMACERPVLASVGGEAARIVEESGAGRVTAPADSNAIAGGVMDMLQLSRDERKDMGRRGRAYVAEHYDRRVLADRYLDLLREVVESPAASPRAPVGAA